MNEKKTILFIYPPFSEAIGPYIGIPVLASYLRSKNIPVSVIDLNSEFYYRFISRDRILTGKHFLHDRFSQLNNKSELCFSDAFEYWNLCDSLVEMEEKLDHLNVLNYPYFDFGDIQESQARDLMVRLAFLPYYPETLSNKPKLRFLTSLDEFTSSDIINSCKRRYFYSELLEDILEESINGREPDIIGISIIYQQQVFPAFQCADYIKRKFPRVHITMGGPFISTHFRQVQEKAFFTKVDSFILDEGEIPLEKLWEEYSKDKPDFNNIPGLVYLKDKEIVFNEPPPLIDMEKSPAPDFSVFQLDKYFLKRSMVNAPFRLSRGCKWRQCSFCRTNLPFCKNHQQPSYPVIFEQLMEIIEKTKIKNFQFSDESFDPGALEYISNRILKEKIKIRWFAHTRISKNLDKEKCQLFRNAGCYTIALGIESFDQRMLKLMRKGINSRLVNDVLRGIDGVVPITAYMMIGFPTETEQDIQRNYNKIQKFVQKGLVKNVDYNIYIIQYGSDVWDNPGKYGVSDMYFGPGQDLFPNIARFNGTGISRAKAFAFFTSYSSLVKMEMNNRELVINDKQVKLKFSLNAIRAEQVKRWDVLYLPVIKWLEEGNKSVPMVKPI